ncbi:dihydroorotate dehydrogenase electron transfer subunit [Candidatus Micrarchaeota archaeon]|nr:dihydroorotate dehydrogenase electron transfer subunit [Candidatus Micrarchaeota archaeon]
MCDSKIKNPMRTASVKKTSEENYRVKTLELDAELDAQPGQFIMVWMPGNGERPISIGNDEPLTISVANVGKVSGAICGLKNGDALSYRGPLGKPFTLPKPETGNRKRILLVGGGYGVVPLHFLAKTAKKAGVEAIAVIGARNERDIIYDKKLGQWCGKVLVTTDDGSRGKKGNVMVEVEPLLAGGGVSCVYACGPERMMVAVTQACKAKKVPCQVSLERYMKCGMGVCGSCDLGGKTCCRDGPVFSGDEALVMAEFGKTKRNATGRMEPL